MTESHKAGRTGEVLVEDGEIAPRGVDGAGVAWLAEDRVAEHLASGSLVRVLEDWCLPFPGFFLYYPSRKQQPAALAALIEALEWKS